MIDVEDWYEDSVAREQRRTRFIERFAIVERRRCPRRWCNFREIADWCARERGGSLRNEDRRVAVYHDLIAALLDGKFDKNGRSVVLYLAPEVSSREAREPARLDKEWARELLSLYPDDFISLVLDHCWLPHALCHRWFMAQRIDPPGDWFSTAAPPASAKHDSNPGAPCDAGSKPVSALSATRSAQPSNDDATGKPSEASRCPSAIMPAGTQPVVAAPVASRPYRVRLSDDKVQTEVAAWVRDNPAVRIKRDDFAKEFQKRTNCERANARSAYRMLPVRQRFRQGKPAIN
jgi:hypothetical protein